MILFKYLRALEGYSEGGDPGKKSNLCENYAIKLLLEEKSKIVRTLCDIMRNCAILCEYAIFCDIM